MQANRLDARESAFFARECEFIKRRSYDTKQKPLKAFDLIPLSSEAGNGATEITYRRFTGVGFAKIIADYAKDFPRVDVYGEETTVKVKGLGSSFGYSIKEIRQSMMTGKALDTRRADTARRAIEELINTLALSGDSNAGINGLINYPGISEYTVLADGTGASKLWSAKTADQIVRDISGMVNSVVDATNGRETPDTLLMDIAHYNYIATTKMSTNSDLTILQYVLQTSPFLKKVDWLNELKTAGAGSTSRMMCYVNDDMHLSLEIPQGFEQFEPQQEGMEFEIPCHAETAGVIVYYPLSVAFGDGI